VSSHVTHDIHQHGPSPKRPRPKRLTNELILIPGRPDLEMGHYGDGPFPFMGGESLAPCTLTFCCSSNVGPTATFLKNTTFFKTQLKMLLPAITLVLVWKSYPLGSPATPNSLLLMTRTRFYPRGAMLARVFAIVTCPSVCHVPVLCIMYVFTTVF